MLASLATLVSGHPARLLGHLKLYGDLMSAEAAHAMRDFTHRVAYVVAAVELLICAITLGGIAVLLAATVGDAADHWALWAVPAVPLVGALLAWLKVSERGALPQFLSLRKQVAAAAHWLAERDREDDREAQR
jgi:cytochrome bd-type quinol oxidase subunit 2